MTCYTIKPLRCKKVISSSDSLPGPVTLSNENFLCKCRFPPPQMGKFIFTSRRPRLDPWVRKTPWRRKWQPTPVFLLRESHGQRSLQGYSPWGRKELDRTKRLTLSLSLGSFRVGECWIAFLFLRFLGLQLKTIYLSKWLTLRLHVSTPSLSWAVQSLCLTTLFLFN